jgi:hypothetical protein
MTRTNLGIEVFISLAFPSLADVFDIRDEYHTSTKLDASQRTLRFIGQVGALCWSLVGRPGLWPEEAEILRQTLEVCYRKLGLDSRGSLPGRKHRDFQIGIPLSVPPLHISYTENDWAEWLWDNAVEQWALLPVQFGPIHLPQFESGLVFVASEGRLLNVLEDVGAVEKMRMITEWVEVSVTNKRIFRSSLSSSPRSYLCRYRDVVPDWFTSVQSDKIRVPLYYGL